MADVDEDYLTLPNEDGDPSKRLQPEWSNAPSLAQLKQDYQEAKQVTDEKIAQINRWLDYMHVRGEGKPKTEKGKSAVQPPTIRKQAEWRYSSLSEPFLSSPNIFEVNPVTWEDAESARQNGLVLNQQFNTKLNKQRFIDEYVRAGVDEGTIIVKVGWNYQSRTVKEQVVTYEMMPDSSEELAQIYQTAAQIREESPSEYPEIPEDVRLGLEETEANGIQVRAMPVGSEEEEREETVENHPTVQVCDYNNIVIDPSCGSDFSKAKFLIETFESSYAELKADGRYKNLDKIQVEGQNLLSEPDYTGPSEGVRNFDFQDKSRKRLVVHEYWGYYDIHGDGVLHPIVATWLEESPSEYPEIPEDVRLGLEETEANGIQVRAMPVGSEEEEREETVENHPTVQVCDYNNIVIDPSCGSDFSKAKFLIETFESSYAELKADGRYKNLDKIQVEGQNLLSEPDYTGPSEGVRNFDFQDKSRKRLVVHEYWGYYDIHGDGVLHPIVATWVGAVMIRMEENPFPDKKIPYVVVNYIPRKRDLYGESDGALLIDNQRIIGAVTRGMIDTMARSANGQVGVMKGALDVTNRRRFDRGENYEFNPGADPRAAVHMHTFPEIPQSAQYMINLQQAEAESMTGVKAFNAGISGAALGDTATAVRGALDAASKRELGILRRLSAGIIEIGRKIIAMNAEFLDDVEVVRITNEHFVDIRRDDLAGNFDLKLDISTAEEDNAKVNDLTFMLQTMGPNMDPMMAQQIMGQIMELKKMPDFAKRIREFQPQPDPIAQQKAQLELMLLQAQIEAERARAANYMSGAGLQDSKVGTEQAKARALASQADMTDLNFLEQESGVQQARKRELQQAQSEAQGKLAMLNSQLKRLDEATSARTSQK
ncbi:portal protein [Pseudomonas phage vB_Pae575P-3]|uniref:Portal protein n=3 Tax=root TaxID=1 RepID=A0A1X9I8J2_9CAUD|nr:portal protein [Pseudomonas phage vB_Pae575P-3]ANT44358.1 portal protein [Pseudomonas phage vB_Pae575P-3]